DRARPAPRCDDAWEKYAISSTGIIYGYESNWWEDLTREASWAVRASWVSWVRNFVGVSFGALNPHLLQTPAYRVRMQVHHLGRAFLSFDYPVGLREYFDDVLPLYIFEGRCGCGRRIDARRRRRSGTS